MQASTSTPVDTAALARDLGVFLKRVLTTNSHEFFAALQEAGISFSQLKCLGVLSEAGAPLPLGALADELALSPAAISRAVDGLVQRGELRRDEDPRGPAQQDREPRARRAARPTTGSWPCGSPGCGASSRTSSPQERDALGSALRPIIERLSPVTDRIRLNEGNRRWWTLAAMCFALFMIMLDNTVVNVALPSIQKDLGASLSSLEWTVNAYTLTFAVLLVTGGRLGDIFGRRRMFLFGVVVFALSSAAIGLAPDQGWLVAGRAVQGVGAAFMMPATLSIITVTFPAEERGKAIGTWAGVSALALAIGPVVGGALTEYVSWRAIFFLNLPVAVGAVAVTLFAAHESRDETHPRTRSTGPASSTISTGLTALVLALIEGNSWGWGSPEIVGAARDRRGRPRRLRADRAARARSRWWTSVVPLAHVPGRERGRLHRVVRDARDVLLPRALHAEHPRLLGPRGRRALPALDADDRADRADRRPADRPDRAAAADRDRAVARDASRCSCRRASTVDTGYGLLLPAFILMGIGMALTMSPMSTAAMNAVDRRRRRASRRASLSMSRMVGGTFGVAALGALFQHLARNELVATRWPAPASARPSASGS